MKIRIKGNSLRIRLSKSEVDQFAKVGQLEECTNFLNSTLFYGVKSTAAKTMSADFNLNKITIFIPQNMLMEWAFSNKVSLVDQMPLGEKGTLQILLEKDFKCIDADVNEDQSDYFENPLKSC